MGDVDRLIEEVRVLECLWKVNSKVYKVLRAKENAWNNVGRDGKMSTLYMIVDVSTLVIVNSN